MPVEEGYGYTQIDEPYLNWDTSNLVYSNETPVLFELRYRIRNLPDSREGYLQEVDKVDESIGQAFK